MNTAVPYEKYFRDGKVAVLATANYGAGWYSWNKEHKGLAFDRDIVQAVIDCNFALAAEIAERKYKGCYTGGACNLSVAFYDQGLVLEIDVRDGCEIVKIVSCLDGYLVT